MGRPLSGLDPDLADDIWRRHRNGDSATAISRGLGLEYSAVYRVLSRRGGVLPRPRASRPSALRIEERELISRGLVAGRSIRSIAAELGRAPSTISREIGRNGGQQLYRATSAHDAAKQRARRPKVCKLAVHPRLRGAVVSKLKRYWSPEQISAWLKGSYPDMPEMHVSHETIYQTLFIQARGLLKKELMKHLRTSRRMRRSRNAHDRGKLTPVPQDMVSIAERPPEAEDRAVPGHWEGDLIEGSKDTYIATLVERATRYVLLVKVRNKTADEVARQLSKEMQKLPDELKKSLTWDRGTEMTKHREFSVATGVPVYFCDPQSPWQRGSNENTNGLLRQYFPKGSELSAHSQAHLRKVARELNERPRKTLGWATPAAKLAQLLQ